VVDDEPALLRLLKMNLEMEGHEPFLAGDGETAIARIESEQPDVVLLDVMMPALDGWQVLQRISDSSMTKKPKVIVLTAKVGDRNAAKAFELGASDYIPKPFDLNELMERIDVVLNRSEEEAESRRMQLIEEWS
jgi:DNA-binding response OmpR family regulator